MSEPLSISSQPSATTELINALKALALEKTVISRSTPTLQAIKQRITDYSRQNFPSSSNYLAHIKPIAINDEINLDNASHKKLTSILQGTPINSLAKLGKRNLEKINFLLTPDSEKIGANLRLSRMGECLAQKNPSLITRVLKKLGLYRYSLFTKIALAHQLADNSEEPGEAIILSSKQLCASLTKTTLAFIDNLKNSHENFRDLLKDNVLDLTLQTFNDHKKTQAISLKNQLIELMQAMHLSAESIQDLNAQLDSIVRMYQPTENFYKNLENPVGRLFESELATSMVGYYAKPSLAMTEMMQYVMAQIKAVDPSMQILDTWSQPSNPAVYDASEKILLSSDEAKQKLYSGQSLGLFYDFHHFFITNFSGTNPTTTEFNQQAASTYLNDIIAFRGDRRPLPRISAIKNTGGITLRDNLSAKFSTAWQRPSEENYADSPHVHAAAWHEVPLALGPSGRANVHTWGQAKLETSLSSGYLNLHQSQLFMLGLWATLCSDGGHSLHEVLISGRLAANRAIALHNHRATTGQPLADNLSFLIHLNGLMPLFSDAENSFGQHTQFYSKIPDPEFQQLYRQTWQNLCESNID